MTPEQQGSHRPFRALDGLDAQLIRDYLAGKADEPVPLVFAVEKGGRAYCELN